MSDETTPTDTVEPPYEGAVNIPVTVTPVVTTTPAPAGTVVTLSWEDDIEEDAVFLLGKYNKFLVALAGTAVSYLATRYGANHIVKDVVFGLTALGVFQTPNVKG